MSKEWDQTWEAFPLWKKVALFLTSLPFVILARWFWQTHAGIWPCLLFWVIALADEPIRWPEIHGRRRLLYGLALLGSAGNALATVANGGFMPVAGKTDFTSVWAPLTDAARLRWLCDIYWGSSLGDMFILAGMLGLLANWLLEKTGAICPEATVPGKRLPGLGIG